ncbi:MAG: DNA repair protein RecO [Pseudomonadota bacterium]
MIWSCDNAIILSIRKFGENSAIINLITPEYGLYSGIVKGMTSKSKRGIYQIGNIVSVKWQARLQEHLGMLNCELVKPVAAFMLDNRLKLSVLNSAVAITEKILLEREKQELIFHNFLRLLNSLCEDGDYLSDYVRLEFNLLRASGFGIDISCCAATGDTDNLIYVSPKSGRAVSKEAGKPYHDKMLPLPDFLKDFPETPNKNNLSNILDGLKLCGYFIKERVVTHRNIKIPDSRMRLFSELKLLAAEVIV